VRNYTLYLKDIVAAVESIEAFVEGMDLKAFQADDKTARWPGRSRRGWGRAIPRFPGRKWLECGIG